MVFPARSYNSCAVFGPSSGGLTPAQFLVHQVVDLFEVLLMSNPVPLLLAPQPQE